MSAHKKNDINLLPQRGFEATTTGRVVGWFLGTFRIILIITEIIVMGAFLSRFYLDAKNSDLTEQIQQKKAVIESYAKTENDFRSVQNKLKLYSQLVQNLDKYSKILNTIRTSLPDNPGEINLDNIQLSSNSVTLNGKVVAEKSVLQFITNLENSSEIHNVKLTSITSNKDSAYLSFALTMSTQAEAEEQ